MLLTLGGLNGKGAMESQDLLARFRQSFGDDYADFLTADWGPPPHLCPFCRTETLHKLLIADPTRMIGSQISTKWYLWCEKCLRGIYCPPGTYVARPGMRYVLKGDEDAIRNALPPGLKLIKMVKKTEAATEDSELD